MVQIGEAKWKEKGSFTSLTNQIESELNKGYSETEIIEAVCKAVSPILHLRDLLAAMGDLTLPTSRTILIGNHNVDSSNLLFKFVKIFQDPKKELRKSSSVT